MRSTTGVFEIDGPSSAASQLTYPEGWSEMWGEIARMHEARVFSQEYTYKPVNVKSVAEAAQQAASDWWGF